MGLADPPSAGAEAPPAVAGACASPDGGGPERCVYRSFVPSAGVVVECRGDDDCRAGSYAGDPAAPRWFAPPRGFPRLPRPRVGWHTALLAEVRFGCGARCSLSYFHEVRRKRLSPPVRDVLAVDARRALLATAAGDALVMRQMFSGREVARLERPWAGGPWLGESIRAIHFDPDGRLTVTWAPRDGGDPVTERVTVPPAPR